MTVAATISATRNGQRTVRGVITGPLRWDKHGITQVHGNGRVEDASFNIANIGTKSILACGAEAQRLREDSCAGKTCVIVAPDVPVVAGW